MGGPVADTVDAALPRALTAAATSRRARVADLHPVWMAQYRIALVTLDLCCLLIAATIGCQLRFGFGANPVGYLVIGICLCAGWAVALQAVGAYEIRHLASGPEEAKRVLRASGITVSLLAICCYVTETPIARGFVVGVVPVGVLLLLVERHTVRRYVVRHRVERGWMHRIIAVGSTESVLRLVEVTRGADGAGLQVIGACVNDAPFGAYICPGVPVVGTTLDAARAAGHVDADVVAVTGNELPPTGVRELGWQLEGTGTGLVVAPGLTQIAGPRVHVSPVEGLPLVWLDQPQLGRIPQITKRSLDVALGSVLLLIAAPVLLASAAAVKLTSRGPVFYRQRRLGVHGTEFMILKFRSMYVGSEGMRDDLLELNDQDGGGILFKIRRDPRVTPVGRILRRFSIDELPQLLHVLRGTMSLVGPRPLAAVDSVYTGPARRRLLVRPGLTGLWQVSGRSELSWDDAIRLDLYYVENWSVGLDISIIARTVMTVVAGKGAY
jgi:exopolysaccharide biosynthesis polyprenyl glycosylphosphotransferase